VGSDCQNKGSVNFRIRGQFTPDYTIFLLPVGKILGFTISENKMFILIAFHSEEVLLKVPRKNKHQTFILTSDLIPAYIAGELPPIGAKTARTYSPKELSTGLRKRLANFQQSTSLQFNRYFGRKDRLSARPTGLFEMENEEDIKRVLAEMQNAPLIHADKRELSDCNTNSYHLENPQVRKVISYNKVIELFGGTLEGFQKEVKSVRRKLKCVSHEFKVLQLLPPGRYLGTG
jgi:hypothetical protein